MMTLTMALLLIVRIIDFYATVVGVDACAVPVAEVASNLHLPLHRYYRYHCLHRPIYLRHTHHRFVDWLYGHRIDISIIFITVRSVLSIAISIPIPIFKRCETIPTISDNASTSVSRTPPRRTVSTSLSQSA